jgi:glycosyltransferase involved in cell wall biosynthesis
LKTKVDTRPIEISDPDGLVEDPVVSVVLLAYNHAAYITQAIESVLAQKPGFAFELVIGEDCSTDETGEIVRQIQRANPTIVRIVTAGSNVGFWQNWLRIMAVARGRYIAQLDGDDYWLPNKLARQVAHMEANPACPAIYSNALVVSSDGAPQGLFNDVGDEMFTLSELLRQGNFLNTSSMLFRSSLLETVLSIDRPSIDYRIHLAHARVGSVMHLAEPLAVYRNASSGSLVTHANARVREMYWEAILSVPRDEVSDEDFARGLADFLRRVLLRSVRMMQFGLLRQWAPRVFAAAPFGVVRMSWYVVLSALRTIRKEVVGRCQRGSHKHQVLHRR